MFISDTIIYLHVPRTAGGYIEHILSKNIVDGKIILKAGYHRTELPPEYKNQKVVTSIRNPFDWYVSYWSQMTQKHGHREAKSFVASDTLLEDFVQNTFYNDIDSPNFGIFKKPANMSLINYFYNNIHNIENMIYIRFKKLHSNLISLLGENYGPVVKGKEKIFHTSSHEPYATYYTNELTNFIIKNDTQYIQAHYPSLINDPFSEKTTTEIVPGIGRYTYLQ